MYDLSWIQNVLEGCRCGKGSVGERAACQNIEDKSLILEKKYDHLPVHVLKK